MISKIKGRYNKIIDNKRSGFAMVGLIITIVIIVILAGVFRPNYKTVKESLNPVIDGEKVPVEDFVDGLNQGSKDLEGLLDDLEP